MSFSSTLHPPPLPYLQVDHALNSLEKAMKWDEETFGLEYDLDLFNIVAVDDFNMGAMENKSLNLFNSRWGAGRVGGRVGGGDPGRGAGQ